MADERITFREKMQLMVMGISSGAFLISVIVKLFSPLRSDIRDVTTVFIIMTGFVFGSNIANFIGNRLNK